MTVATRPEWLSTLHPTSPFEGLLDTPVDLQGWGSDDPVFGRLIAEVRPELIVEVGSWKGASAIHMSGLLKKYGIDGNVLCVDTWLGSLEQWLNPTDTQNGRFELFRVHGHPIGLYCQFMSNVKQSGFADVITPFPTTSHIAARWLAAKGVKADLIYLDGSHEYEDVLQDLQDYWPLLSEKGVLFGDDYASEPGVKKAVEEFCEENPFSCAGAAVEGNKWVLDSRLTVC